MVMQLGMKQNEKQLGTINIVILFLKKFLSLITSEAFDVKDNA